jgi:hypothetical protein
LFMCAYVLCQQHHSAHHHRRTSSRLRVRTVPTADTALLPSVSRPLCTCAQRVDECGTRRPEPNDKHIPRYVLYCRGDFLAAASKMASGRRVTLATTPTGLNAAMDLVRHRLFLSSMLSEAANGSAEQRVATTPAELIAAKNMVKQLTTEIMALGRWKYPDQLPAEYVPLEQPDVTDPDFTLLPHTLPPLQPLT